MAPPLRGLLSVLGAFLIQLTTGTYHGTFGNLLPYFSSYMRKDRPSIGHGDLAQVFSSGGLAQGITFMLGGLLFVPLLGRRGCLVLGSLLFTLAPILTHFTLNWGVPAVCFSYGVMGAGAVNIIMLPSLLIPVTWFPEHKGLVLGIVTSGFGLSSTLFSPLQTLLINPSNLPPLKDVKDFNSTSLYFAQTEVLENLPPALLYIGAIYAALFLVGFILCVEKPATVKEDKVGVCKRLKAAMAYLVKETFTRKDFYLLWLTRFLFLVVGSGFLAHWKNLAFTQSQDDKLVSIIGGVNGVVNFLSRVVAGTLLDRIRYRILMPTVAGCLCALLLATYWVAKVSFPGLVTCIWLIYGFSFCHFSTVPAQAIGLFRHPLNSVVVGTIGLADTFSYGALGILNSLVMSNDSDPLMFLYLFLVLAACSFLALVVTACVSSPDPETSKQEIDKLPVCDTVPGTINTSFVESK